MNTVESIYQNMAGIYDGDGETRQLRLRMVDREALELFQQAFGGNITAPKCFTPGSRLGTGVCRKQLYSWHCPAASRERFKETVGKYLRDPGKAVRWGPDVLTPVATPAYLGGLFRAEGCVSKRRYRLEVKMLGTDMPSLYALRYPGRDGVPRLYRHIPGKNSPNAQWEWASAAHLRGLVYHELRPWVGPIKGAEMDKYIGDKL